METMVIGSGGREHALAMAIHEGGSELVFSEANAGMQQIGNDLNLPWGEVICDAARDLRVDLAVVGPELPLVLGISDDLRARGVPTLGASQAMAQLEASKSHASAFMDTYDIPHPATLITSDRAEAMDYVRQRRARDFVIKADGLASGKGVKLPKNRGEAESIISGMISGQMFGEAGRMVNLQDRLHGQEVSMIALLDGEKAHVLGLAQDYKRLQDGDKGPNTGGMGSYSPVSFEVVDERQTQLMYEALSRTIEGMNREGINSPGFLYIGFMLAEEFDGDPVVLEYNVRSGDPETQVILPLLQAAGVNVAELFEAAAHGSLDGDDLVTAAPTPSQVAITVCLASEGYPEDSQVGRPIYSIDRDFPGVNVYHGATRHSATEGGQTFTDGGRVLYPTGLAPTALEATAAVYDAIGDAGLYFEGMQFRSDIGHQAVKAIRQRK